jgi:hypothetical protein
LSNSSVSIRSEFQTSERSVTLDVGDAAARHGVDLADALLQHSPVRNTAQSFCIDLLHVEAQLGGRRAALGVAEASRRESARSPRSSRQVGWLRRLDGLAAAQAGRAAEHHEVDQRVGAEAVGAVHRHAGRFADAIRPGTTASGSPPFLGQTSP